MWMAVLAAFVFLTACTSAKATATPTPVVAVDDALLDEQWARSDWASIIETLEPIPSARLSPEQKNVLYGAYVNQGSEFLSAGQRDQARIAARKANSLSPSRVEAQALLAEIDPPVPTPISVSSQVVIRELGAYRKGGTTWKNLLIKPGLDKATLINLAREIHNMDSGSAYRFFDDDAQFRQFMDWDINYPNPRYPFPEAWTNRHHIGNVQQMFEGGGMRWGFWGPYGGEKIAPLD